MDSIALVAAAQKAAANAHAPYSGFGVGAAILLADGSIVTGSNLENASYGVTLCAEAVTLGTANSLGKLRDVRAIAVIGGQIGSDGIGGSEAVFPCGRCRQMIIEAVELSGLQDIPVYCASADGSQLAVRSARQLLPDAFGPRQMGIE